MRLTVDRDGGRSTQRLRGPVLAGTHLHVRDEVGDERGPRPLPVRRPRPRSVIGLLGPEAYGRHECGRAPVAGGVEDQHRRLHPQQRAGGLERAGDNLVEVDRGADLGQLA